jgi:hypothetical protein
MLKLRNNLMKKELRLKLEQANLTCFDCGKKYGEPRGYCATFHNGRCDVCGEEKSVTETRDYGYFNKTLKQNRKDNYYL